MGNTRDSEVLLVYDRQCPACEFYCRHAEIDAAHGTLRRIDARESSDIRDQITRAGLDIDQGMVLVTHDRLYYGADAIHEMTTSEPCSALQVARGAVTTQRDFFVYEFLFIQKLPITNREGARHD